MFWGESLFTQALLCHTTTTTTTMLAFHSDPSLCVCTSVKCLTIVGVLLMDRKCKKSVETEMFSTLLSFKVSCLIVICFLSSVVSSA